MKATIGKWHRDNFQPGLFRSIHGGNLIGQYIIRCSKGWAVSDCPSEYGVSGIRTEHALLREAKQQADKRLMGAV